MKTIRLLTTGLALALLGSVLSARGAAPTATTLNASNIVSGVAKLNGRVNPNSASTQAYFQWGLTTNYDSVTAKQTLTGSSAQLVTRGLSNLASLTTYHFRMVGSNSSGLRFGTNQSFISAALLPPEALSYEAASIGGTSAVFTGTVNPNGSPASAWFEWGTSLSHGNVTATQQLGGFSVTQSVVQLVGSLTPNTTYIYRLRAVGDGGESMGGNIFFTTGAPAQATVAPATSITLTSAVLNGAVHPGRLATLVRFEWGAITNYSQTSAWQPVGNGNTFLDITQAVSGLMPLSTNHFRVVASNELGLIQSADQSLPTTIPPTVATLTATAVTPGSAMLNGSFNPNSSDTTATFEWGTTTAYGQFTPPMPAGAGTSGVNLSAALAGLAPGVTYHYRAVATNAYGTGFGEDSTFAAPCVSGVSVVNNCTEADLRAALATGNNITFACDGTITLTSPIPISCPTRLDASLRTVVLRGSGNHQLFQVLPGGSLELINLTLSNGVAYGGEGGAILVTEARLSARNCHFKNSFAQLVGGAISAQHSQISLSNCFFLNNAVSNWGGAMSVTGGVTVITNCQFVSNQGGGGGALWMSGATNRTTVRQSLFATNSAAYTGGALIMVDGILDISLSTFHRNYATVATPPGHAFGGAMVMHAGTATLEDCVFSQNESRGAKGYSITISRGVSGTFGFGGALAHLGGNLSLSRSTFRQNLAQGGNGDIPSMPLGSFPGYAYGGAIYDGGGSCKMTNCTLTLNQAVAGTAMGGSSGLSSGGAIASGNNSANGGQLTINACTIASNRVFSSSTPSRGGGMYANNGASIEIINTILHNNSVNTAASSNAYVNGGTFTDLGRNLSSDSTPAWTSGTSLNNTDARLLPLANNGGPTLTMALRTGSPALNAADPGAFPATDQRGFARPSGSGPDIGAYEGPGTPTLQIVRVNSSTNALRWMADAGQTYRLEAATVLNAWSPFATNVVPVSGPTEVRMPVTPPVRYFRLLAE